MLKLRLRLSDYSFHKKLRLKFFRFIPFMKDIVKKNIVKIKLLKPVGSIMKYRRCVMVALFCCTAEVTVHFYHIQYHGPWIRVIPKLIFLFSFWILILNIYFNFEFYFNFYYLFLILVQCKCRLFWVNWSHSPYSSPVMC